LCEETTQIVFDFLHLAVIFYTVIGWRFLIDIPENFVNYQESDVEQEYVGEFASPVKIYRTFGVRAAKSFLLRAVPFQFGVAGTAEGESTRWTRGVANRFAIRVKRNGRGPIHGPGSLVQIPFKRVRRPANE
jgi:hypothetical protein